MLSLFKKCSFDAKDQGAIEKAIQDLENSDERYVYKLLQNVKLSKEAQDVLDKANKLLEKSFEYRSQFNAEKPSYQIFNWDCGYYQLNDIWEKYFSEEFKEFKAAYNVLADKMRPQVYELGMLKK